MAGQLLLNNVTTKLTAQLLVAGVTANVTAGSGALFAGATGGNYIRATLVRISGFKEVAWEIVYVTARSTDALTITRAQEGTAALQFEIGDTLEVRTTAKTRPDVAGVWCGTAGGTANALTLTPATPILAYEAGMSFIAMSSASANTAATTVAISGLGTIAAQSAGAACAGGEIPASKLIMFTLDTATTAQVAPLSAAGAYAALAGSASQAFAMSTAAAGTNTTQGASTAFVINEFGRHENLVVNPGFTINNGNAGVPYVSAAALASGEYGHEMWKAGSGGGDYSFTQLASDTTITIASSKTLIQVIEDKRVQFTSYVLAWDGTAQARYAVDSATPAGSYAASPITITGQTVGTTMSIEFNTGTLGNVRLSNSTSCNKRDYQQELALSQRYFEVLGKTAQAAICNRGYNGTGDVTYSYCAFAVYKRATPTMTAVGTFTVGNTGQPSFYGISPHGFQLTNTITTTGAFYCLSETTAYVTAKSRL